jgi:hypothetical protein
MTTLSTGGTVKLASAASTGGVPAGGSNTQAGFCGSRPNGGSSLPVVISITPTAGP